MDFTNKATQPLGWKDNISFFSMASGKGTNEPIWEDRGNGNYTSSFVAGDELFIKYHINHDYALGTKGFPHIHFSCKDVQEVGATVTWRFSYVIAKGKNGGQAGESLGVARTDIDIVYTYDGTEIADEHIIVECDDLDAFILQEPDAEVDAGVVLLSTTTTGKVFGEMLDLHYQSDRDTTPNKEPDFYN